MKCRLVLELSAWDQNPECEDAQSDCLVVYRDFALPFPPSVGMEIHLHSILTDHPYSDKFRKALKRTEVFPVTIFEIERVKFGISIEGDITIATLISTLKCQWGEYPKIEDRDAVADQLVYGYGFRRWPPPTTYG